MCPDRPEEVAGAPDQVGTSLEKFIIGVCLERIPASLLPPDWFQLLYNTCGQLWLPWTHLYTDQKSALAKQLNRGNLSNLMVQLFHLKLPTLWQDLTWQWSTSSPSHAMMSAVSKALPPNVVGKLFPCLGWMSHSFQTGRHRTLMKILASPCSLFFLPWYPPMPKEAFVNSSIAVVCLLRLHQLSKRI